MKGTWQEKEVKDLFASVESSQKCGGSLKDAFSAHAEKFNRARNSVRNYYYHELRILSVDEKRRDKLGIDLAKHEKNQIQFFTKDEEKEFVEKIEALVKEGNSIRSACMILSGQNARLMLRYQNKYRNILAKNREKKQDNIIKFVKKRKGITDEELTALFGGLVRLVKRTAREEAEEQSKAQEEWAGRELRKTIALLGEREKELGDIKKEFIKIKEENEKLLLEKERLSCQKANSLRQRIREKRIFSAIGSKKNTEKIKF